MEISKEPDLYYVKLDDKIELRELTEKDAEELFRLTIHNREHLREWLGWVDETHSVRDTLEFLELSQEQHARNDGFQVGIWLNKRLIGAIGYHYMDWQRKETEVGYWITKEYEGQGIVTRACEILIDYAFSLGLEIILICCAIENSRSRAIPERLGFVKNGLRREGEWLYDHYVDLVVYRLHVENWRHLRTNSNPTD